MKSPYRNTDGLPETGEVTVAFRDDRFPVGRMRPTIGLIMSLTSELTTADEATPMTKPMASPITPNVWRKSTNSLTKPFFFSVAFSILSIAWFSEFSLLITATENLWLEGPGTESSGFFFRSSLLEAFDCFRALASGALVSQPSMSTTTLSGLGTLGGLDDFRRSLTA